MYSDSKLHFINEGKREREGERTIMRKCQSIRDTWGRMMIVWRDICYTPHGQWN